MASLTSRIVGSVVRANRALFYRPGSPVGLQRYAMSSIAPRLQLAPRGVRFEPLTAGSVPALWVIPEEADGDRVILYLHGGGYVIGSVRSHRKMVARIAVAARCRALMIDYRLAPEHMFPAAVDDAVEAYRWLLAEGYAPGNIVIAGDSAGGGLTAATLVALRDLQDPMPAAAVMLSPWVDLEVVGESARTMARKDPLVTVRGLKDWAVLYAGDSDLRHPLVSPIHADLTGLPPLLIHAGTNEILLDDSMRLAERARRDGVAVELDIWDDMYHVWHFFSPLVPESARAVDKVGEYCRSCTGE
jgi:epsilon-lactone hydrolase